MQKIFDVDNKEDMDLLWSILPEEVVKIEKDKLNTEYCVYICSSLAIHKTKILKINWHDKTEITRPVNYESMIGCVGWFGSKKIKTTLSILKSVDCTYGNPWFECKDGKHWDDFTPAKKSELKFWGDD